jgi:hypothetical protein|nr:MAG TPA: hypothetical protein [Caudoviricetes sp.]
MKMKPREFYDKVVLMRRMQKEYFKNRSSIALQKSKQLEKEIDDEITRVEGILGRSEAQPHQGNIFDYPHYDSSMEGK